jgi:GTP cyclohydrolase I
MSSQEVKAKAKETLRSVRELLEAVTENVDAELKKNAPRVANTLDRSFEAASKSLTDTLRAIDRKTGTEQVELLKAYRSFIQKQAEIVQGRISDLEKERKGTETKKTP